MALAFTQKENLVGKWKIYMPTNQSNKFPSEKNIIYKETHNR